MDAPSPVPDAAVSILNQVRRRIAAIVRANDGDPILLNLPPEIRQRELPSTARRYFALAARLILEDLPIDDADLDLARERGAQRADDGVPLSLVLHNWYHGAAVFWEACVDAAGDEHAQGLGYIGKRLHALEEQATRAVVDSYQAEQSVLQSADNGGGELLASLLLSGKLGAAERERWRSEVADNYSVLALRIGPSPDEDTKDPIGRDVAGRRKLRQIRHVLNQYGRPPVHALLDPGGGHILVPERDDDTDMSLARLVGDLQTATRGAVTAAASEYCDIASLSRAAELADDVLALVAGEERSPGLYRLSDVALAYQLSRPTEGREQLAALLRPLEPHRELIDTLDSYVQHDLDRRRTARALQIHPNTVNNRLNRITELLGTDLGRLQSVMSLAAALLVRRQARDGDDPR